MLADLVHFYSMQRVPVGLRCVSCVETSEGLLGLFKGFSGHVIALWWPKLTRHDVVQQ
jgi:hypothetical protein